MKACLDTDTAAATEDKKKACLEASLDVAKSDAEAKYASGKVTNPYTGAVWEGKPKGAFNMADYEGGGLARDGWRVGKEGKFTVAERSEPPKDSIVAVFVEMDNANCKVQASLNKNTTCFFKCMTKYVGAPRGLLQADCST